jgi:prepilin-type N-terminal cleavage/methylation domain-containing protein
MQLIPSQREPARRGFTLIELMVVLTIIVILVSLSVGAIVRIVNLQQRRNTEQLVHKLDGALMRQWNAVIAQAKNEQPNPIALRLAGADSTYATPMVPTDPQAANRAKVIHVLMSLRREFPVNFAEIQPYTMPGVPYIFAPNQAYVKALPPVATWPGYTAAQQSSACLYLALKQRRAGAEFDPDTALSSKELAADANGVRGMVDAWGNSIIFSRWPVGLNTLYTWPAGPGGTLPDGYGTVLTLTPPAPPPLADPQDPEWLLTQTAWLTWLTSPNQAGFVLALNLIVGYPATGVLLPGANMQYKMTPVIMSYGGNGKFDGTLTGGDDLINYQLRQ